jgi:hypothetical protein
MQDIKDYWKCSRYLKLSTFHFTDLQGRYPQLADQLREYEERLDVLGFGRWKAVQSKPAILCCYSAVARASVVYRILVVIQALHPSNGAMAGSVSWSMTWSTLRRPRSSTTHDRRVVRASFVNADEV